MSDWEARTLDGLEITQASSAAQIAWVRELFLEYANSLSFSLCFQSFESELAQLPGDYRAPEGRLLLATIGNAPAGCVALHKAAPAISEMKRLYVRPPFRGRGLGKILAQSVIAEARQIGYRTLRLESIESMMQTAVALYRSLGFEKVAPYRLNPIAGALYMELRFADEEQPRS